MSCPYISFSVDREKVGEEKVGEAEAVGTVRKPLAVFHGLHSRSEGEKGEVTFSLRRR